MSTLEPHITPDDEVTDFKWVFVMGHWDVHLNGVCSVNGELLFFRLASDPYSDDPLEYRIYRFRDAEKEYFLRRKAEFERQVGMHWTYDEEGKNRGPGYAPRPEFAGPRGVPLFYSLPKEYDFDDVASRSDCVGRYIVA